MTNTVVYILIVLGMQSSAGWSPAVPIKIYTTQSACKVAAQSYVAPKPDIAVWNSPQLVVMCSQAWELK